MDNKPHVDHIIHTNRLTFIARQHEEVVGLVKDDIAQAVLTALGGKENIQYNTVCMTRLRVTLVDPSIVNYEQLNGVNSVLGTATRGYNGLEVVFGPRIIDGVYHSFVKLTGVKAGTDALFPMSRQESSMRIQINPAPRSNTDPVAESHPLMDSDELNMLDDLFGDVDEPAETMEGTGQREGTDDARLLVVNGPNINMLIGDACDEVPIVDYPSLLELCKDEARAAGFTKCDCYQSNHEGDLIDRVQDAFGMYEAMIINPGERNTLSPALCEAIRAVGIHTVVVNLFEPPAAPFEYAPEDKRIERIAGKGVNGYRLAIERLARQL